MATGHFPAEFALWIAALAQLLDARVQQQLSSMFLGLLFARGRRTVTSWLRALGVRRHYENHYYFLGSLGRKCEMVAGGVLRLVARTLPLGPRVLLALDDSPIKRYGPKVEGAGIHHNPTPGPAGQKFLYGHVWVTMAALVRHPQWGTIALPLAARLYVRLQDIFLVGLLRHWAFHTKLELGAALVEWAAAWLKYLGKTVWVVADGAYAKRPFLTRAAAAGVTRSTLDIPDTARPDSDPAYAGPPHAAAPRSEHSPTCLQRNRSWLTRALDNHPIRADPNTSVCKALASCRIDSI